MYSIYVLKVGLFTMNRDIVKLKNILVSAGVIEISIGLLHFFILSHLL